MSAPEVTSPSRPWTLDELEEYVAELGPEMRAKAGVVDALAAAVEMLRDARTALGPAWLAGGATLAEGIARKCAVLERVDGDRP